MLKVRILNKIRTIHIDSSVGQAYFNLDDV